MDTPTTDFPIDTNGRMLVPATFINTDNRLRQVFLNIDELAADIAENGLIQPIVIERSGKLVDGHRRFKALTEVLNYEAVPCVYKDSESSAHSKIMEIMANIAREDFTWQERVLGIVEVHELTQREQIKKREKWTREQTAELMKMSRASVNNAIWLAELIRAGDKEIIEAAGVREALDILIKRREDEANKRLAQLTLGPGAAAKTKQPAAKPGTSVKTTVISDILGEDDGFVRGPVARKDFSQLSVQVSADDDPTGQDSPEHVVPLSRMIVNMDCVEFGLAQPAGFCDHIITDIPYGTNTDFQSGISEEVAREHTVEGNIELYNRMFPMFVHALKDKGFVVMWYDLDHHQRLTDLALKYGFSVQRWPLLWCKTDQCKNDAANQNFTKNYEVAMVLRKGNASLTVPQNTSYFHCASDRIARQLGHPYAKPLELWRWVYSATTLIGQTVFDPFCGVGSSLLAATEHGLRPLGCEKVEEHYNKCIVHVADKYKQVLQKVRFE
jgi:hypothetical protein